MVSFVTFSVFVFVVTEQHSALTETMWLPSLAKSLREKSLSLSEMTKTIFVCLCFGFLQKSSLQSKQKHFNDCCYLFLPFLKSAAEIVVAIGFLFWVFVLFCHLCFCALIADYFVDVSLVYFAMLSCFTSFCIALSTSTLIVFFVFLNCFHNYHKSK